jgi:surfeit locus 1 family protein
MNKRMIVPALFGIVGVAVLLWLGAWQMQRLAWKQDFIARIEARIDAAPVALPKDPQPARDKFLSVAVSGRIVGPEVHVLASREVYGAGYKVITAFVTDDGRRVLLDRGFIATTAKNAPRPAKSLNVTGNLHWPDETDGYTPAPDLKENIWFARDVDALAKALNTEPVLIMAATDTGDGVEPYPLSSAAVPNDHLQYAITWFLLAAVWFGMTVYLLSRIKRKTN